MIMLIRGLLVLCSHVKIMCLVRAVRLQFKTCDNAALTRAPSPRCIKPYTRHFVFHRYQAVAIKIRVLPNIILMDGYPYANPVQKCNQRVCSAIYTHFQRSFVPQKVSLASETLYFQISPKLDFVIM